jgi:hypothetical protein
MTLEKGWLVLIFNSAGEVNKILQSRWKWGAQNHFMKKSHVNFYSRMDQVNIVLVWVRIPRLPLVLWLKDVFVEIGKSLGLYY